MVNLSPKTDPINILRLAKRLQVTRQALYNNKLEAVVAGFAELQRKNFSTEVEAAVLRRPLEERIRTLEKENEDLRRKLDGWIERWVAVEYNARLLGKDADKLFEPIQPPQRKTLAFPKGGKLVDEIGRDRHRSESKKSGQQRGADNVQSLTEYLEGLDRVAETIPLNPDGGPNYSEIARHCGFGRQVFYTNEKARTLVDQHLRRFEECPQGQKVRKALHKADIQDRRIQSLEERVATLSAEIEALRRQNRDLQERLRQYELIEEVMSIGRYRP